MKMKSALFLIGGFTLFLGLSNFATSALQERVSTCETRINSTQLQIINQLQMLSSNEIKIVQQVLARQIEIATGVPGPSFPQMEQVLRSAQGLNERALRSNEMMREILEEGCELERQNWVFLSMITVMANSAIACLAFWLGLRVVDSSKVERPVQHPASKPPAPDPLEPGRRRAPSAHGRKRRQSP
ncbi:MAG TPA: hypothetical protein VJS15_05660 [Allosphingosinicella sp.]|nr:hypothetical protein [Allosphingosinicella sp.]